jgi:hypothetical protein
MIGHAKIGFSMAWAIPGFGNPPAFKPLFEG